MKIAFAVLLGLGLYHSVSKAAPEVLVDSKSIVIQNASYYDVDISNIYGGIAGTCTPQGLASLAPCDSCSRGASLQGCNQRSVYPALPFTITFKSTKEITTAAKAKLYMLNSTLGLSSSVELAAKTYTVGVTEASLGTTWARICEAAGMTTSCTAGGVGGIYIAKLAIGIDSDNSGDVDPTTTESKIITVKIHYIASGDAVISNNYCVSSASTPGFCKIEFEPGDGKVYIKGPPKHDAPITGGPDTSFGSGEKTIDFDAIAIFPIKIANFAAGPAAITGFTGDASPIIRLVNLTDNTITEDEVSRGDLENYQTYCFIYGNRNKAQNIYRMVAGASADGTTVASQICLAPSEVAGLLQDKHCFISTAAFGSDMANEVQIFRNFRNRFLLTNKWGRIFVHFYYKISPPIAEIISNNDILRAMTRTALYPFLAFGYIALNYGIFVALFVLVFFMILIFKTKTILNRKNVVLLLAILIFSPNLKAQIVPSTKIIQHPDSQEGLVRITKDGTYVYDIKRQMKKESSRITFGHALQPEVSIDIEKRDSTTGNGTGEFQKFEFGDLYEETTSFIIGYDYERFYWVGKQGKLGIQLGGALMYAKGHGILQSTLQPSREEFTFFTLPFVAGAVYRMEWKDKQIIAPYVSGGGTYTGLVEKREDKSSPQYTGAPGFYVAGGALINVTAFDDESGFALDSEYGISNLWVSLEYKAIEVNSDAFVFSNRYVNLGIAFDF